jgi:hypothetical protein
MAELGREEGWRRSDDEFPESVRATSGRLRECDSQVIGPSKPAEIVQPAFAGITTAAAEQWPAIGAPSAKSMGDDPDRAAPPADDLADTNLSWVRLSRTIFSFVMVDSFSLNQNRSLPSQARDQNVSGPPPFLLIAVTVGSFS